MSQEGWTGEWYWKDVILEGGLETGTPVVVQPRAGRASGVGGVSAENRKEPLPPTSQLSARLHGPRPSQATPAQAAAEPAQLPALLPRRREAAAALVHQPQRPPVRFLPLGKEGGQINTWTPKKCLLQKNKPTHKQAQAPTEAPAKTDLCG